MKTRIFLTSLFFLGLSSCVTERVAPPKEVAKKLYAAKLKLGDVKIESQKNPSGEEALISSQFKSLKPGFYQIVILEGSQCPPLGTLIANENRINTDPFYVADSKPQTIIRQTQLKSLKAVTVVAEKKEELLSTIDCAPIRPAIMKP